MGILHFGSNGWQARVGSGFNESSVARIADSLGRTWASRFDGLTVMVGFDTRRDSERMALVAGRVIAAHGLRVIVGEGPCPTPALGWSVAHEPSCVGGIMVTASESPRGYNGILARQADGGPVPEGFAERVDMMISAVAPSARGTVERGDLVSGYMHNLSREADVNLIGSRGLRVVVDPMYGAMVGYASRLFETVGCEVIRLHDEVRPDFRGLHPDPHEPWVDECECAVVEHGADMGIVFDGDGDRVGLVDSSGRLVSQHDLAPMVMEYLVEQRVQTGRVVATVASSARVRLHAERLGCEFTMVPVGFSSIYREFAEPAVLLAAEESGGICLPSHLPERDACVAALSVIELMAARDESVREVVTRARQAVGPLWYGHRDLRLDASSAERLRIMLPGVNPGMICGDVPTAISHADGLRVELPDTRWMLLRPSRSRPLARVCAEAPDPVSRDALLAAAAELCSSIT